MPFVCTLPNSRHTDLRCDHSVTAVNSISLSKSVQSEKRNAFKKKDGGRGKDRTYDPYDVNEGEQDFPCFPDITASPVSH
jgi:hypothetical protein